MAIDYDLILRGQAPDIVGSMSRGNALAGQVMQQDQARQTRDLYITQGAGISMGDPAALNALAQLDPAASMDLRATKQRMDIMSAEEQRAIQDFAAKATAQQKADAVQKIEDAVKMGTAIQDPQTWDQVMSQQAPELVGQFAMRDALARKYMSMAEAIRAAQGPSPIDRYKVVGGTLMDLSAKGGPKPIYNAPIGGGGTTVNVGVGENEFDKTIAKADATALSDLQKAGLDANAGIATLGAMEAAMADPNFYSGSAAGSVEAMRRAAVSLGIADPSSVTSMESFGALAKGAALAAMGGSLGAGFSNADRDFVEKQVPTLGNTPEGNASIIRIQKSLLRRKQELAALAQEYAAEQAANGQRFTQTGFEKRAREFAEANPLFADQARGRGASQSSGGVTRFKWNPETGDFE